MEDKENFNRSINGEEYLEFDLDNIELIFSQASEEDWEDILEKIKKLSIFSQQKDVFLVFFTLFLKEYKDVFNRILSVEDISR